MKTCPPPPQNPICWEEVFLMAYALLTTAVFGFSVRQTASAALGLLLSFDCFCRSSNLSLALSSEVRPPARHQSGAAAVWTITLFHITAGLTSKSGLTDDTISIGTSSARRAFLVLLLPAFLRMPRSSNRLLDLTKAQYSRLFHEARCLAGLNPGKPHMLRHGGASMDALDETSELKLMDRGRWQHSSILKRYRRPAAYLRRLRQLTSVQLTLAHSVPRLLPGLIKKRM